MFTFAQTSNQLGDLLRVTWFAAVQGKRSCSWLARDQRGRSLLCGYNLLPCLVDLFPKILIGTGIRDDNIGSREFLLLRGLGMDTLNCVISIHTALAHQSFDLHFLRGVSDPDGIATCAQIGL